MLSSKFVLSRQTARVIDIDVEVLLALDMALSRLPHKFLFCTLRRISTNNSTLFSLNGNRNEASISFGTTCSPFCLHTAIQWIGFSYKLRKLFMTCLFWQDRRPGALCWTLPLQQWTGASGVHPKCPVREGHGADKGQRSQARKRQKHEQGGEAEDALQCRTGARRWSCAFEQKIAELQEREGRPRWDKDEAPFFHHYWTNIDLCWKFLMVQVQIQKVIYYFTCSHQTAETRKIYQQLWIFYGYLWILSEVEIKFLCFWNFYQDLICKFSENNFWFF